MTGQLYNANDILSQICITTRSSHDRYSSKGDIQKSPEYACETNERKKNITNKNNNGLSYAKFSCRRLIRTFLWIPA